MRSYPTAVGKLLAYLFCLSSILSISVVTAATETAQGGGAHIYLLNGAQLPNLSFVTINDATTVAAAFALAGFADTSLLATESKQRAGHHAGIARSRGVSYRR